MNHFLLRNECTINEQIRPIESVITDNLPLCSNSIVNMPFDSSEYNKKMHPSIGSKDRKKSLSLLINMSSSKDYHVGKSSYRLIES